MTRPTLILLNGASSSGKSTIARELQKMTATLILHAQVDSFTRMLPDSGGARCLKEVEVSHAERTVRAFHAAVCTAAQAGTSVIVDHVIGEDAAWIQDLSETARAIPVVCVGVHCDLAPLLDRESRRQDRAGWPDVARRQFGPIHAGMRYDVEVDTTRMDAEQCARRILDFVNSGAKATAWEHLASGCDALPETVASSARRSRLAPGCVQVYTGDGKGKTTAAVGLAARACGAGLRVFIGQFIKGSFSSEMALLRERCREVTIEQFGLGRFIKGDPSPEDRVAASRGVERLHEALRGGEFDVVIADEANGAVSASLIGIEDLLHLLEARPANVELVITGRNAHPKLVERADLVTEMLNIKHCFDAGVPAREGIDY